jgi:hypothetical protein
MIEDGSAADLDLYDVLFRLERFFGFNCTRQEWRDFFLLDMASQSPEEWIKTVAPQLTFGSLASFVAERAPVVASFDPIPVFGRNCAAAGIFAGMQQIAANLPGSKLQFAPSTRIVDVMRGTRLNDFWTRLRWMTENAAPELQRHWRDITFIAGNVGFLTVIGGLFFAWLFSSPVWFALALGASMLIYAAASAYKQTVNPIPRDIVSFRDLSILIAKSRE